jgi:NTE family protein
VLDILKGRGANGSNGEKVGLGSIRKPVIGLALGGGAARGFAHIGILRTLAANGIVPDVVVGTSIGAVVGGLHAAGRLDTFEEWGRSLQGMRNILGYLDIRLNGSGLLGGEKLATRLEEAVGQTLVEDLPIKFATVATEVRTGHEIWLTRGRVVDAMRASYALPGIFSPVLIGDRWLVDGALVNPVPVSAARALGAEIVIAANLSSDIFTHSTTIYSHGAVPAPAAPEAEETTAKRRFPRLFSAEKTMKREFFGGGGRPGISSVMVDAFNIMQDRITRARLAGDPPDLLISPRVGQFGWFDFHRSEDLIAHGARAAERALESIQEAIEVLAPAPAGHAPKAGSQGGA